MVRLCFLRKVRFYTPACWSRWLIGFALGDNCKGTHMPDAMKTAIATRVAATCIEARSGPNAIGPE